MRRTPTRSARRAPGPVGVTGTMVAGLACATLPSFLIGALQGRITAEFGIGAGEIGLAVALFFVAGGVTSIPAGRIVDRIGSPAALRIGMGLAAASSLLIAALVTNAWQLTAALAIAGPAMALVDTAGSRAMSRAVPHHRQGVAFGTKEASPPIASLVAGLTLPLIAVQFGWRPAFVGAAVVATLTGLMISSRLESGEGPGEADDTPAPVDPDPHPAAGDDEAGDDEAADAPAVPRGSADATPTHADVRPEAADDRPDPGTDAPSTTPLLILLAASAATAGAVGSSVSTFLVPTAEVAGMTAGTAGVVLSVASLAAACMRVISGATVDRLVGSELLGVAVLTGAGSLGVAGLAFAGGPFADSPAAHTLLIASAVLALGGGWASSGLLFLSGIRIEPARPALSGGVVLSGLALGGSLGRVGYGFAADHLGFAFSWGLATPLMASAAVVALVLRHRIRAHDAASVGDHG